MTAELSKPPISPEMKVAEFLKHYPELEGTLMGLSPAFAKLQNPILRKTVAKVASLKQAAMVGDISVGKLISELRKAAGVVGNFAIDDANDADIEKPTWLAEKNITESFDAIPMINQGEQPLTIVVQKLNKLDKGQVLELLTPFYPAPLIDKARSMGFKTWTEKVDEGLTKSYFFEMD